MLEGLLDNIGKGRCRAASDNLPNGLRDWVFPSPTSATGHVQYPHHVYRRISKAGGAKFCFHGLRNCFITVADELHPNLSTIGSQSSRVQLTYLFYAIFSGFFRKTAITVSRSKAD